VIVDIEGATSEPTRRRHVVVLSAAMAGVSLVLLFTLVFAPQFHVGTAPLAAAPAPSASAGPVKTIVSSPTMTIQSNPISQLRVDLSRASVCADGTRLDPPYHLGFAGDAGPIVAGRFDGGTGRPVSVTLIIDGQPGWLTVSCATSDDFGPRIDRAR